MGFGCFGWLGKCSVGRLELACARRDAGIVIFADGDGLKKNHKTFLSPDGSGLPAPVGRGLPGGK
jgi:hypothetical protein